MAVIEEALKALLVANGTVNTAVSGRVYPVQQPAGAALPAIVYQRVSGPRVGAHSGPSGLAHPRFQFTCIAATYAAAKALANAVRVALDGYAGSASGIDVDGILVENEVDGYNFEDDERASSYAVIVDAVVWHHE